jgi:hypothetical protein
MKLNKMSALAGVGAALIVSSAANAAFVNLVVEEKPVPVGLTDFGLGSPGVAVNLFTCNVYAVFNAAGDKLDAVFGDQADPASISTNHAAGFFNHPNGGADTPPSSANFGFFGYLAFDSFYTIGEKFIEQNASGNTSVQGVPALTGMNVTWNNGSYFTTNDTTLGTPDAQGRVLIAQLSVRDPNLATLMITGNLNLQWRAGTVTGLQARDQTFLCGVPTPGTLALLGLAGLVGPRRRRA